MAIIKCPECGNAVSDKAANCIHCGYPLNPVQPQTVRYVAPLERSVAIVYGIQQTGLIGGTVKLYIDGDYVASVGKGDSVEIPVNRDCTLTAKSKIGTFEFADL